MDRNDRRKGNVVLLNRYRSRYVRLHSRKKDRHNLLLLYHRSLNW